MNYTNLAKFIEEGTGEPCEPEDILHVKRAKCRIKGCPQDQLIPDLCYDHAKTCLRCKQPYDPAKEHVCLQSSEEL